MPGPGSAQHAVELFQERLMYLDETAQAEMVKAYAPIYKRLQTDYNELAEVVKARGAKVKPWEVARLQRYKDLEAQFKASVSGYVVKGSDVVTRAQRKAVGVTQAEAYKAWRDGLPSGITEENIARLGTQWNTLPDQALENFIGMTQEGQPLDVLFDRIGPEALPKVRDVVTTNIALGIGGRQAARELQQAAGLPLSRSLTIARTEINRAHREATRLAYKANDRVVKGYRRSAAKSPRTCMACIADDGTVYSTSEAMPTHPNCRCGLVPITITYQDLGLDLPEPPTPVNAKDWLASQPSDIQLQVMGRTRFNAYQHGKLDLGLLSEVTEDRVWGDQLRIRSLKTLSDEGFLFENDLPVVSVGRPFGIETLDEHLFDRRKGRVVPRSGTLYQPPEVPGRLDVEYGPDPSLAGITPGSFTPTSISRRLRSLREDSQNTVRSGVFEGDEDIEFLFEVAAEKTGLAGKYLYEEFEDMLVRLHARQNSNTLRTTPFDFFDKNPQNWRDVSGLMANITDDAGQRMSYQQLSDFTDIGAEILEEVVKDQESWARAVNAAIDVNYSGLSPKAARAVNGALQRTIVDKKIYPIRVITTYTDDEIPDLANAFAAQGDDKMWINASKLPGGSNAEFNEFFKRGANAFDVSNSDKNELERLKLNMVILKSRNTSQEVLDLAEKAYEDHKRLIYEKGRSKRFNAHVETEYGYMDSIITHELGHYLHKRYGMHSPRAIKVLSTGEKWTLEDTRRYKGHNGFKAKTDQAREISEYAMTNDREFFAEAYLEYTFNPDLLDKELVDFIKEVEDINQVFNKTGGADPQLYRLVGTPNKRTTYRKLKTELDKTSKDLGPESPDNIHPAFIPFRTKAGAIKLVKSELVKELGVQYITIMSEEAGAAAGTASQVQTGSLLFQKVPLR